MEDIPNIEGFTVIPIGLDDLAMLTVGAAIQNYISKLDYINKGFEDLTLMLKEEPELREKFNINMASLTKFVMDLYNVRINFVSAVMRLPEPPLQDSKRLATFREVQVARDEAIFALRDCRDQFIAAMEARTPKSRPSHKHSIPRDPGFPGV